ncbi:MAG: hypothetical protein JSV33_14010 [bacterium]|nr:MAG: hypothetical protein JSV33_14010 [bacterium]
MRNKSIVTSILLTFVFASIIYLVVGEYRKGRDDSDSTRTGEVESAMDPSDGAITEETAAPPVQGNMEANGSAVPNNGLIAYYFHGNRRCATCRKIEQYTREAIESGFERELQGGTLIWKPVNVDVQENSHFISKYELSTRSVVIVRGSGREETDWKKLEKVWELVGNRPAFIRYIQDEVRDFL